MHKNDVTEPIVGKKYHIRHSRKGAWNAVLLRIDGDALTGDEWYIFSDDPSSPVRASFCRLAEMSLVRGHDAE